MSGLDKILNEIRTAASAEAGDIVKQAQQKADSLLDEAQAEADAQAAALSKETDRQIAEIESGRVSALQLQKRQKTLETKQQLLAETLEKARRSLYDLPTEDYAALLVRLAATHAQPGEGVMLLNQQDQERLPASFVKQVNEPLPQGTAITMASKTRPIDGGFVLQYGDIEINCSFEAIFDANKDDFTDTIQGILFP